MDNLEKHIEDFLTHIRIKKNYSEQTKRTYRIALTIFAQFLQEANLDVTDRKCITLFIRYLNERGNSDITIAPTLLQYLEDYLGLIVGRRAWR